MLLYGRVPGDCTMGLREEIEPNVRRKASSTSQRSFPNYYVPIFFFFFFFLVSKHKTNLWVRNQQNQFIMEAGAGNGVGGTLTGMTLTDVVKEEGIVFVLESKKPQS
jgi:hypothetical protein